jgi:Protein of unknown function (DUF2892)
MSTPQAHGLLPTNTDRQQRRFFVPRNVGSTERFVRIGVALVAALAAARASGWSRAALNTLATAGLTTGLTRYCPVNRAIGRDSSNELSPLDGDLLEHGSRL